MPVIDFHVHTFPDAIAERAVKKLADIFQCSIDELLGYCRPRTSHERWR